MSEHAEKVEGIGLIRVRLENLAIDLLSRLQLASLVVLDCNRERFGNRGHFGSEGESETDPWQLFLSVATQPASRNGDRALDSARMIGRG